MSNAPADTTALEVDETNETCYDSDYGSSVESETQSIASSLMAEYFEQNGRRYHTYFGPNKNPLPADDTEQERLDIFHELLYLAAGSKFHQAPVAGNKEIQNVLDLGTGTGIWAIDFAQENPHAQVIGLDLTPIQPGWVPPNCRFQIDDFELDWTFRQTKFDYIHARTIVQCVNDWPRLMTQIWDNLNPGGWLELAEGQFELRTDDNSMPDDYPPKIAFEMMAEGLKKSGRIDPTREIMLKFFEDKGFTNIHVKTFKVPIAPWPKHPALKQAGGLYAVSCQTGYEAYLLNLGTRVLGLPEKEVLDLCERAYQCHLDRNSGVHAYWRYHVVYGQKPKPEEE